jgi:NADH dehydrogenase
MKTKIVIVGGGFAGLYAAMHLDRTVARRGEAEVVLISRDDFMMFTPMLHEVAAGDLAPADIVNAVRRTLRHVKFAQAEVQSVDVERRTVRCLAGTRRFPLEFAFDHLLLALGSETNFFDMSGVRDWAVTMKTLQDAALLRNLMVALLEEAALETDASVRRRLMTFVIAGGGFAGVETAGAVNDFVRDTSKYYPSVPESEIRVVIVHPGGFLLPELGEQLGIYAEHKLRERRVEVVKGIRVANYDGSTVQFSDNTSVAAATLIWTAGVKPSGVIGSLPLEKEHGRLRVNEFLAVPGVSGLWAVGDCAAALDPHTGSFYPPTAQHGTRQGVVAAKNIVSTIQGRPLRPFRYKTLGLLASIGHQTGVAMMMGMKFSGFLAWSMWRSIYLAKLPGLAKKMRVLVTWTLDLFFGREIEQMITIRDVEALSEKLERFQKSA